MNHDRSAKKYTFESPVMATDLTQDCALFRRAQLEARHKLGKDRIEQVDPNFTDSGQLQSARFFTIDKPHDKVEYQD